MGKSHKKRIKRKPSPIRRTAVKPDRKKARSPTMPKLNFENKDNLELNKNIDLGNIKLELDYESLGEIEIIAEETTVEVKLDKKIYTVGRDLSVRGGNAGDVLDNIPSVSVDIEGNILLRGNDAARILIKGLKRTNKL